MSVRFIAQRGSCCIMRKGHKDILVLPHFLGKGKYGAVTAFEPNFRKLLFIIFVSGLCEKKSVKPV